MKRQKHVFPTVKIAHLWAHKVQGDARNPRGNFYKPAILFTSRSYSSTTSRHKSMVRVSIPYGLPVFEVDGVCNPTLQDVKSKVESATRLIAKAIRARGNKPYLQGQAQRLLNDAQAMATFWGIKYKVETPEDLAGAADAINADKRKRAIEERERNKKQKSPMHKCQAST